MTGKSESKSESRVRTGAYASPVGAALLIAACLGVDVAQAQAIMRMPTISVPTRTPTISPSIASRVGPTVSAVAVSVDRGPRTIATIPHTTTSRLRLTTVQPYARYSPNLYPACTAPYRDADGECLAQPNAGGGDPANLSRRAPARAAATSRRSSPAICAASPTNSWPRSTARCRPVMPTRWPAGTA